ncbi:ribosomal RNA-processing protein 7 homolog A [Lingula anatina]|uniref:Ribosomal RNA-processing protein 7 homolog A n=1 Tax=Lingula anatina TaxID=7574 RepID=A0A1S3HVD5_LINAN|nr:ribosomal RNA-processing protein 7 homolog A [Lingula anatina]|eukprot:XP_013389988.1 ribosomal RNA-processing protein 7 homolog A [Lingula anatina]
MEDRVVINGFTVIPLKLNKQCKSCHHVYLKEHSVRETDAAKPKDRTLFILNLPPYCNEECLKRLFSDCGKIENIHIQQKPSSSAPEVKNRFFKSAKDIEGFRVAYIVFHTPAAVKKAKQFKFDPPRILSTDESPVLTGMKKWCQEYKASLPNVHALQKEIDAYMEEFDKKIQEEAAQAKEEEGVPDDEGWVTVTRHSKNKGVPRTEAQEKRVTQREKKKRKEKELLNFYAFQVRESKMEQIAKLRQKFEEDKQKISLMRASRKFRPY